MKNNNSRRKFLKNTGKSALGFYIVPRHVLGGQGFIPPSDKLNLAAIGAGGKGFTDIKHSWNNGKENVLALCDIDEKMAKDARKLFPKAKFYKDFRTMLDKNIDIDAVTVSTPDHTHATAAGMAMSRGIHVYVQKPLTHNIHEARYLTELAREKKVVSQMGNQGASNPAVITMQKWIKDNEIGMIDRVHVWTNRPVWPQGIRPPSDSLQFPDYLSEDDWNLFIGPAEFVEYHTLYHPFKWRGWWNFGTGALGDMGCHLIDIPFRLLELEYPSEVECSVGQVFTRDWVPEYIPQSCPPSSTVQLLFNSSGHTNKPIVMNWYDGGIRPFHPTLIPADHDLGEPGSRNGVLLIGEKGIISCGVYGQHPKLYKNDGEVVSLNLKLGPESQRFDLPEFGHHSAWTAACKAGFGSKEHKALTSSFDYSGPLTETVLMGNLAIRSYELMRENNNGRRNYYGRKKLIWDGKNTTITNFDEANQFVRRSYRDGWKLEY